MAGSATSGLSAALPGECDVIVVGSGASGLATAVSAAKAGLKVIVVEKSAWFGGTTCFSAGVIWIPGNQHARHAGISDDPARALAYLEAQGGEHLDRPKAELYVERASSILDWFEANTHVRYDLAPAWPDYHPEDEGASSGGRSLGPRPFDGRTLGSRFMQLRPPLATTTIFGGMMVGREDLVYFYGMQRSWRSALHVGGLFLRYARDRLTYPRGTRLSNGNALIAMLAQSAFEAGVELHLETPVVELTSKDGKVVGIVAEGPGGRHPITARHGVVLACGGFPASEEFRRKFYPHVAEGKNHHSLAPSDNVGDGVSLGTALGVEIVAARKNPAAWTPVSLVPQPDGSTIPFPHFFDRGKAGYIAVDRHGRRFVNEAISYHDFVPAMVGACRDEPEIACHLICDSRAIARYGLGMAPPRPGRLGPHVRSGYIKKAGSLEELAQICGIDPAGLAGTVERFNRYAAAGEDPQFGKGSDVYQRFNGSFGHKPNPCLARLMTPPFYAVKLVPGDIGTFVGLKTNASGQAINGEGKPLPGLYVVGNDAASFMGGSYPGAGITIGPALVFGHIAAEHIAANAGRELPSVVLGEAG